MDLSLIFLIAAIATIIGVLYDLFIGQKTIPDIFKKAWRWLNQSHRDTPNLGSLQIPNNLPPDLISSVVIMTNKG
jgi:hypothetical protein